MKARLDTIKDQALQTLLHDDSMNEVMVARGGWQAIEAFTLWVDQVTADALCEARFQNEEITEEDDEFRARFE